MLELNGLAERMKGTIMEGVRSMLAHAKLSKTFWAGVLMTTVYVINKSPSTPLDKDIPQRLYIDKVISYRLLRVLVFLLTCMLQRTKRENWTRRLDHAYSFDMTTTILATGYGT